VELIGLVLAQIDLRTLTDFRRINNRAMQVVDSIPEYRLVQQHTPDSIRGILSVELGSPISVQTFFKTLNESRCEDCGDFAGFIYLFTCKRVCFIFLDEKPRYYPLSVPEAVRNFGVCRQLLALPALKSIPGFYSPNEYTRKARFTLVDSESIRRIGIERHGSEEAMEQYAAQKLSEAYQHRGGRGLRDVCKATSWDQSTGRSDIRCKAVHGDCTGTISYCLIHNPTTVLKAG